MATWKTPFADVSSFHSMLLKAVLSAVCSSFAPSCFEMMVSSFASAVEESWWPLFSSLFFPLKFSGIVTSVQGLRR